MRFQNHGMPAAAGKVGLLQQLATILLCLSTLTTACAEQISRSTRFDVADVTVTVSKPAVQVAEPLVFELKVVAPAATKIMLPSTPEKLGNFDVIDHQDMLDIPFNDDAKQRMWIRKMTLESIVTGDMQIPAMELQIVTGDGTRTLTTEPLTVQVLSVLEDRADPTQFHDIQSVIDMEVPEAPSFAWLWWTLGGVGLALLAVAGALLVAKRKNWMSPQAWAIRELEQLQTSAAMKGVDSETVCQEVSVILRDYLELQYDIPAPSQATDELLQVIITACAMSSDTMAEFGRLFKMVDQARFAGLPLSQGELASLIDDAKQLMETTIRPGEGIPHSTPT